MSTIDRYTMKDIECFIDKHDMISLEFRLVYEGPYADISDCKDHRDVQSKLNYMGTAYRFNRRTKGEDMYFRIEVTADFIAEEGVTVLIVHEEDCVVGIFQTEHLAASFSPFTTILQ